MLLMSQLGRGGGKNKKDPKACSSFLLFTRKDGYKLYYTLQLVGL
jgi:hypothetical protein